MNELDILFPAPVMLQVGDESIPVLPLTARQFAPMMRAMQPVIEAFRFDTKEVDIDALMENQAALRIVVIGIACDEAYVAKLKRNELLNALLLVLGVNPDLFFPDVADSADEASHDTDFSDTFQRLISAGHRWVDIQGYTLAQIRLFDAAAGRFTRSGQRIALLSARAAWSDSKIYLGLLKALEGVSDGQQ
jgi:hypothetical protein